VTTLHVVVPDGVDDPTRPSGGNTYDLRVCRGLAAMGWSVALHAVAGAWPAADSAAQRELKATLASVEDGGLVLIDGLISSSVPDVLSWESTRLRLVILMHMPLGASSTDPAVRQRERRSLQTCAGVIATSDWTRAWLTSHYALGVETVHVATPGVDPASSTTSDGREGHLLCVAAVTPTKGQDVLLEALVTLADLPWTCTLVGSLTRDVAFADAVRARAGHPGIADRVTLTGPLVGGALDDAYRGAGVVVLPSRAETYGMVITEALARGIPVVATDVGGTSEALGTSAHDGPPGLLVPADDVPALAAALRRWLADGDLRARLQRAATARRQDLLDWSHTSEVIARVLTEVAA